ncbi:hypothetical protein [Glycocaulis alkaliphilus]|nr:hypothetical protein [Glycocaulis alkaliphilus]
MSYRAKNPNSEQLMVANYYINRKIYPIQLCEFGKSMRHKNILKELGPLFAGFQIAATLLGTLGIGAFANWVVNYWFPFTRWAWGGLFDWVNLPDITAAEKDALTTLMFFLPLAITSIFFKSKPADQISDPSPAFQRTIALGIGFVILYIMAGSVFSEAIAIIESTENENSFRAINKDDEFLVSIIIIILYSIPLLLRPKIFLPFYIPVVGRRVKYILYNNAYFRRYIRWTDRHARIIRQISFVYIFCFAVGVFIITFLPYALNAVNLGIFIIVCVLAILASLLTTVRLDPTRLMKTAGVVLLIVMASILWDLWMVAVTFIETAPFIEGMDVMN